MSQAARASQSDIKRAVTAVAAAGLPIAKVTVDRDGNIAIYSTVTETEGKPSGWEDVEDRS
ncbi:hypothetical protein MTR62_15520 [Novosphingobium sp. 1949]|uniref:Uncharacterized protein n=1 Tax=Novosphingobium organovorum TaxID=2930092 RepID=A0ABT0BGA3_9SPHN|nr:hypothetical protein [Novosphingobium organovorum]MCJ2184092.1 hypothetical protein [Novosphingobium organovorum]